MNELSIKLKMSLLMLLTGSVLARHTDSDVGFCVYVVTILKNIENY